MRRDQLVPLILVPLGMLVVGGLAYSLTTSPTSQDIEKIDDPQCTATALAPATATATASIKSQNLDSPQLSSILKVTLPTTVPLARDLLQDPASSAFKTAVQCLLAGEVYNQTELVPSELRDNPPVITEQAGSVTFTDTARLAAATGADISAGIATASADNNGNWLITVTPPSSLVQANWTDLAIVAPNGWLSTPVPFPPDTVTPTEIHWSPGITPQGASAVNAMARWDARTTALFWTYVAPGSFFATLSYWLPSLSTALGALIVILLLWAREPEAQKMKLRERLKALMKSLARRNEQVGAANSNRMDVPYRLVAPIVILEVTILAIALIQTAYSPSNNWPTINWYSALLALAATVIAATVWGLNWRPIVACGLAAALAMTAIFNLGGLAWNNIDLSSSTSAATIAYALFGFLLCLLTFAGLIAASSRVLRPPGDNLTESQRKDTERRSENRSWAIASVVSVALICERVILDCVYYAKQESFATAPLGPARLPYDLGFFPYTFLSQASSLVLAVPILCLWLVARLRLSRTSASGPINLDNARADWRAVRIIATAMFMLGPAWWSVYFWGWWLPLYIPLVVVVFLLLGRTRYLNGLTDKIARSRIADEVEGRTIDDLRADATQWQVINQRRIAAERSLSSGKNEMEGYNAWLETTQKAKPSVRAGLTMAMRRVTPVDVLLAVGPNASSFANAVDTLKVAAAVGTPAAVFMTWLWLISNPLELPNTNDSILLVAAGTFVWFFLTYVYGGATLGLLWQYLPGRRGPIRALWVAILYSAIPLVAFILPQVAGGYSTSEPLVDALVFTAVLVVVGFVVDAITLKGPSKIWTRPKRLLYSAYGMENLTAQVTLVLAQVGAIIAILTFIRSGGAPPTPTKDPGLAR